jgi:hypothetical protein
MITLQGIREDFKFFAMDSSMLPMTVGWAAKTKLGDVNKAAEFSLLHCC